MPPRKGGRNVPLQRTTRQRRSVNQALKSLGGYRALGFPLRTGQRQGTRTGEQAIPGPPPSWAGTLPEWQIYYAHGAMELVEGRDFIYLYQTQSAHSIQIDFFEIDLVMGIQIQGMFWHYGLDGGYKRQSDLEQKADLQQLGLTMIYIDEDDANLDPIYYLKEARKYMDWSLLARGLAA